MFSSETAEQIDQHLRERYQIPMPDAETCRRAMDEAFYACDWWRFVFLHEPGDWVPVFEMYASQIDDDSYWRMLRGIFSSLDTVAPHHESFRRLFARRPADVSVRMSDFEVQFLSKLPDPLTVYRGYAGPHPFGFSWTLNRSTAMFFAYRAQRRIGENSQPCLLKGLARKQDVLTLILHKDEYEVVIDPHLVTEKKRLLLKPLRGQISDL